MGVLKRHKRESLENPPESRAVINDTRTASNLNAHAQVAHSFRNGSFFSFLSFLLLKPTLLHKSSAYSSSYVFPFPPTRTNHCFVLLSKNTNLVKENLKKTSPGTPFSCNFFLPHYVVDNYSFSNYFVISFPL